MMPEPSVQFSNPITVPAVSLAYVVPASGHKKRLALIVSPAAVMTPLNTRHTSTVLEISPDELPGVEDIKTIRKNRYQIRWFGDPNLLDANPARAGQDLVTPWRQAYLAESKTMKGPVLGDEISARQLIGLLSQLATKEGLDAYKEKHGVTNLHRVLSCRVNPFARQQFTDPMTNWLAAMNNRDIKLDIFHSDEAFKEFEAFKGPETLLPVEQHEKALNITQWYEMYAWNAMTAQAEVSRRASQVILCEQSDRFLVSAKIPKLVTPSGPFRDPSNRVNLVPLELSFEGFDGRMAYPKHDSIVRGSARVNVEDLIDYVASKTSSDLKFDLLNFRNQINKLKGWQGKGNPEISLEEPINIWADPRWRSTLSRPMDLKSLIAEELTPGAHYPIIYKDLQPFENRLRREMYTDRLNKENSPSAGKARSNAKSKKAKTGVPSVCEILARHQAEKESAVESLWEKLLSIKSIAREIAQAPELDVEAFRRMTTILNEFRTHPDLRNLLGMPKSMSPPLAIFEHALTLYDQEMQARANTVSSTKPNQPKV